MRKCKYCGASNANDNFYCMACGKLLPNCKAPHLLTEIEYTTLMEHSEKVKTLQASLTEARRQLEIQQSASKGANNGFARPKGYLKVWRGESEDICPVFEGLNTYGCLYGDVKGEYHQEININDGDLLADRHFAVEEMNGRFRLVDYEGGMMTPQGQVVGSGGVQMMQGQNYTIGGTQGIYLRLFVPRKSFAAESGDELLTRLMSQSLSK